MAASRRATTRQVSMRARRGLVGSGLALTSCVVPPTEVVVRIDADVPWIAF
jgi:hypothetical protein